MCCRTVFLIVENSSDVHGGSCWATRWASPNIKGKIPSLAIPTQLLYAQSAPGRPLGRALRLSVEAILVNIIWGMVAGNTAGRVLAAAASGMTTGPQPAPMRGLQSADAAYDAGQGVLGVWCRMLRNLTISLSGEASTAVPQSSPIPWFQHHCRTPVCRKTREAG